MEPEVLIVELCHGGIYKIFSKGSVSAECTKEEVPEHLKEKLYLFLVVNSGTDKKEICRAAKYFFESSSLEAVSVMYSAVAVSLALGIQNLAVVSLEQRADGLVVSVDLVSRSSLVIPFSCTMKLPVPEAVTLVLDRLLRPQIRCTTTSLYIRGSPGIRDRVAEEMEKKGAFSRDNGDPVPENQDAQWGYTLAAFPSYFQRMMPHNMLPDSDLVYVGAVLTTMIKYFEIKEVNTREDFEAGRIKHLVLN